MRKVWIASILATLMLIVPITNIIGASDTVEDCNCKPTISDLYLVRIERLIDRIERRIDFILLKYGHIPEVVEECEEILSIINSWYPFDIICNILDRILGFFLYLYDFIKDYQIILILLGLLVNPLVMIWFVLCELSPF